MTPVLDPSHPASSSASDPGAAATAGAMDAIVRLTTRLLGVPFSVAVEVLDPNGLAFHPSSPALRATTLSRLAESVMQAADPLLLPDISEHPQFDGAAPADWPVAALAGRAIRDESGAVVGALIAVDQVRREWNAADAEALADLAGAVSAELERRGLERSGRENLRRLNVQAEYLQQLFETSPEAIALLDHGDRVVRTNEGFTELFGYAPDETRGRSIDELVIPDAQSSDAEALTRRVMAGERVSVERLRRRKDGQLLHVSATASPVVVDQTQLAAYVTYRDLSEQRRTAEELRESEERFRSLIEHSSDVVAILSSGANIDYISPAAERVLGYDPQSLVGRSIFTILHPDSAEGAMHAFTAVMRGEDHSHGELCRAMHQDGSSRVLEVRARGFNVDAAQPRVVINGRDVTRERQATKTQRMLNAFLEATPDFVAIFHPHGRALSINLAFRRAVGIAEDDDLSSVTITDLYPRDATELIIREGIPTAVREGVWSGEVNLQDDDGHIIPISQVILAHKSKEGTIEFLSTLGRDITEQKTAEAALRRSEEHFRSLIENALDIIMVVDADGTMVFASPSVERVLGYAPDELVGDTFARLVHPDDLPALAAAFRGTRDADAQSAPVETRCLHRDGSWRVLESVCDNLLGHPAVDGIVINTRDITGRKEAEALIRESELRFRSVVQSLDEGLLMTDLDDVVIYANERIASITGYAPSDLIGQRATALLLDGETETAIEQRHARRVAGEADRYEVQVRRKDGELVWVEITGTPFRDPEGTVVGTLGALTDISERKTLQEQLLQSQKMDAVGRLAGGVAHDFNNLLTAIKGFTELLLLDFDEVDPRRSFITEIQAAANRAASLTRQLLAFSRKQVLQPRVLDLNASVVDMEKMLRRLIGEDVTLATELDSVPKRVKADPGQVEQVILNLAVNARDAMPHGGRITISTATTDLRAEQIPRHAGVEPGQYAVLTVSDTGTGMDEVTRRRVFEPFFTTKEQGKGTGLGLSTVYGIVQQSGGFIELESELDVGSSFRILLPQVQQQVEKTVQRAPVARVDGSETVLLVEDEIAVRVLVRRVLDRAGYHVMEAANGAEALELVERADTPIHILLTDVVMPGISGRELADRLCADNSSLRVLFMSGYTDEAIVHHGVLDAGVSFLEKPFTPDVLLRRLREVLDAPIHA